MIETRSLAAGMLFILSSVGWANVNLEKVMVESQIMKFPGVSLDGIRYKTLSFNYATSGGVTVEKMEEATKQMDCGTSQYLVIAYNGPEVVFRIKDEGRNKSLLLNNLDTNGTIYYGDEKCEKIKAVKKRFEKDKAQWSKMLNKKIVTRARKQMSRYIEENVALRYEDVSLPVYYVKAEGSRYNRINQEFERARKAFDLFAQFGVTIDALDTLREVTAVWEQEVESINNSRKRAQQERKVAMAIHRNLSVAYLFMANYEQARKHDAMAVSKGLPNNQTIQPVVLEYERRYILSPLVAKDVVLAANLFRLGTNIVREAVLTEIPFGDIKSRTPN